MRMCSMQENVENKITMDSFIDRNIKFIASKRKKSYQIVRQQTFFFSDYDLFSLLANNVDDEMRPFIGSALLDSYLQLLRRKVLAKRTNCIGECGGTSWF